MRTFSAALLIFFTACPTAPTPANVDAGAAPNADAPHLLAVGPRLISNQTSNPISVWGTHLKAPATLELRGAATLSVPLTVVDEGHAFGRIPGAVEVKDAFAEGLLEVSLQVGSQKAEGTVPALTLINDTRFPELTALALSPDGQWLFAASTTEDLVYALQLSTRQVTRLQTADGPSALAVWTDAANKAWLVVAHRFAPTLLLLPIGGGDPRRFPAPANASGLIVSGNIAFVAEQARDTVSALALDDAGKERWRTPVGANPDQLAVTASGLAVDCAQSGEVQWLDLGTGAPQSAVAPGPGAPIVGGGTAAFSAYVMNGTAARGLVWSGKLSRLFAATIGPNIGPNPEKMEVSMNAGVSVFEPGKFVRHLGFGAGVLQALALDDKRGLLYAADIGQGQIRIIDARKLSGSAAAKALIQDVALPPPPDFPLVRKAADFGANNRAGVSLHSGPQALALSSDGKTLWVLNRFTGTIARLDVSKAPTGKAEWKESLPLTAMLEQTDRRLGEVLYFADLGRTAMSCDACHPDGHTGGIMFEKTEPLRIYRVTTVRGTRLTPPYFTPASTHSIAETSKMVGGRNRFHNPDPGPDEVERLTVYTSLVPTLPNPFVGQDGAPLASLLLPDGKTGNPRAGLSLFEGRAGCAGCHPGPQFTTDQDPATRGKFLDVGTPHRLPLREKLQSPIFIGFAPPALVGSWDVFPMLTTGSAGLKAGEDGRVSVEQRFALRRAVEGWPGTHGHADQLSEGEKNDLLAYVMSL